ncbi:PadR family transcriptional regulator [Amycolatopsis samaneae]|uniref:Helix-turn-helix transcriptional regulator n=1 Tax=Amycolatopsis samaneae TaxID=664691 RepID=A0ABW5GRT5_9PSEU
MRPPFTGRRRDEDEEPRPERQEPSPRRRESLDRDELLALLESGGRRGDQDSTGRPDNGDRREPAGDDRGEPAEQGDRRGTPEPTEQSDRRRSPEPTGAERRSNRARRGAVRAAALALLSERPMHGYEIMQELAARTNGAWRPSPGAVYPALSLLQDEGMIIGEGRAGKRAFTLTATGQAEAARLAESGLVPWADLVEDPDAAATSMRENYDRLGDAVAQLARHGTTGHKTTAATRLLELRREIYLMLAGESS